MNSTNTVERPRESLDIAGRWTYTHSRFSFQTKRTLSVQWLGPDTHSVEKDTRAPYLVPKGQEVVVYPQGVPESQKQLWEVVTLVRLCTVPHTFRI